MDVSAEHSKTKSTNFDEIQQNPIAIINRIAMCIETNSYTTIAMQWHFQCFMAIFRGLHFVFVSSKCGCQLNSIWLSYDFQFFHQIYLFWLPNPVTQFTKFRSAWYNNWWQFVNRYGSSMHKWNKCPNQLRICSKLKCKSSILHLKIGFKLKENDKIAENNCIFVQMKH